LHEETSAILRETSTTIVVSPAAQEDTKEISIGVKTQIERDMHDNVTISDRIKGKTNYSESTFVFGNSSEPASAEVLEQFIGPITGSARYQSVLENFPQEGSEKFIDFFDEKVSKDVKDEYKKFILHGDYWRSYKPTSKNKQLKFEIELLIVKLSTWVDYLSELKIPPVVNPLVIIKRNLKEGPAFALLHASHIAYNVKYTIGDSVLMPPEDFVLEKLEDIDQMFPARHLIGFRQPESFSDILDYSFSELPKIKKTDRDKLYDCLRKNMKKDVNLPFFTELDSLELANKKSTFVKKKTSADVRSNVSLSPDLDQIRELHFRVSGITKAPDEQRIIAISDIPSRNICFKAREAADMINNHKSDVYGKNRFQNYNFLKPGFNIFHLMLDYKKMGWSYNSKLMQMYFKIASEIYPDYPIFKKMWEIFKKHGIIYHIDDTQYRHKQGFVLGMFDNIASYINSCIFELCKDRVLEKNPDVDDESISGILYGDDSDIKIVEQIHNLHLIVWNEWIKINRKYQLVINLKKSFFGKRGQFCEMYGETKDNPNMCLKGNNLILCLLDCLRGCNQAHRKYLAINLFDYCKRSCTWISGEKGTVMRNFYNELKGSVWSYIGHEFYVGEFNDPYALGGWKICRDECGKNNLLQILIEESFPDSNYQICLSGLRTSKEYIENNVFKKYSKDANFCEVATMLEPSLLKRNLDTYSKKFKGISLKRPWTSKKFWVQESKRRQKEFFARKYKNVSRQAVLNKLFLDGSFKGTNLEYFLTWKSQKTMFNVKVETYTGNRIKEQLAKYVLDKFHKSDKDNFYEFSKEYFLKGISYRTCLASLYKNVSNIPYIIPIEWIQWAEMNQESISSLFNEHIKIGLNIFNFLPPIRTGDIICGNKFQEEDDLLHIYWENTTSTIQAIKNKDLIENETGFDPLRIVMKQHEDDKDFDIKYMSEERSFNGTYESIEEDPEDEETNILMEKIEDSLKQSPEINFDEPNKIVQDDDEEFLKMLRMEQMDDVDTESDEDDQKDVESEDHDTFGEYLRMIQEDEDIALDFLSFGL
jgi:hypothetical protein